VESTHDRSVAVDADHLAEIRNAPGRYSEGEIASGNTTGTTVHFRPDTTVFGPARPSVQSLRALCSGLATTATVEIHELTGI
jgi:hypothetical protein